MPFASREDLVSFTGDAALDSARGQLLVDLASEAIRTYCRQTFDIVENDEVPLRGRRSFWLPLPERPVTAVSKVEIDDVEVDDWKLVRDRLYRTRRWGGETTTVTVTYTHGFAADSNAMGMLRGVCLSVAARASVNPQSATQESIGDWSASWGSTGGGFALTAAQQALLDRKFNRKQSS